jgi:hypothetical protein
MLPLRSLRRTLPTIATAVVAGLAPTRRAAAQFGPPNMGTGPQLPSRGTVTHDAAREQAILEQVTVPQGFKVDLFAGPPVAMYPTSVATSPDGSVYVGVDLNLAQGAVKGRGRVMRLVDSDGDGKADTYSTFIDVDAPRGIAVDGKTVYVMHPPNLTAYHDTNGDGIADDSTDLVKGLGFGLDVRSSDHSTNNIMLGPDGWIYVAVGDYGYKNATGKDGATITRHGGSVVRVRPDGTGLEIYAVGTRNIYDVGIDPFGHVFARDNTNDGGGWNTRFHYIPPNADMGYPSLFLNFADEPMQTLFDFGGGSGTGGLWIQDPGFPDAWNNQLYTSDWTINKVLMNPVQKRGASYEVKQQDFLTISHPVDFTMDDRSHMYVASLIGGVFNYAGDTVGAILRVGYPGRTASAALNPTGLTDAQLLTALTSPNAVHRLWAQRELASRGAKAATVARLRAIATDAKQPAEARASALFTLPLVAGASQSHAFLVQAAADPALREVALRTLVDDRRALAGVPVSLYTRALNDADPAVRVQGINGLVRLGARAQASALVPLLASTDSAVAHLAYRALGTLGARDVALQALTAPASSQAVRDRARFALQLMHDTATVRAVAGALGSARDAAVRRELLTTLARLYNTDAPWNGDWWGTHPTTVGPYFEPATWEGSAAIKPLLRSALVAASGDELADLIAMYARDRVVPLGAAPLLAAVAGRPERDAAIDALIGTSQLGDAAAPLLTQLDAASPALHAAVAQLLAKEGSFAPALAPLVRRAALDASLPADVRGQVLSAVAAMPGEPKGPVEILALINPAPAAAPAGAPADPVEGAWRRYVGARERFAQLDYFIDLARTGTPEQRTLAFAVLAQSVRNPRTPPAIRDKVQPALTAAWADATAAQSLARAIRIMHLESQYSEQLKAVPAPQ